MTTREGKHIMSLLEKYAPDSYDPATDDMTVQFAILLAEKDREIERLREWQRARLETDDAVRALSPPEPTEGMVGILIERVAKAPQHVTYDPLKIIIKPQDEYRIAISKTERDILIAALRAMPLQDHAKEVLCACANSCAKDTESTKLRAALQRMLAVCDIGAHDSYDIYRACEFARSSMVAEDQTSEAKS